MLSNLDLSRKVKKSEFKEAKEQLDIRLAALQREARAKRVPVIVVFEGWDAAGKGTLINELILPLDPRGFNVESTLEPNEEQALRPFLWRFWIRTPERGRMTIFDRSWYRRVLQDRVQGPIRDEALVQAYQDIRSFERQLADDGAVIVKFFLHISKEMQKKRFKKLKKNKATAWRVTAGDQKRHRLYSEYLSATEEMLAKTDSSIAPWTVVEAHDHRFATLKIFNTMIAALERGLQSAHKPSEKAAAAPAGEEIPVDLQASILDGVDLSLTLERDEYRKQLKRKQKRLRELEHEIYIKRVPVVIVYEGWDAAGKGGNIRRLTEELDPRGYEVAPIAAPNDVEKAHHYLWRFWTRMPKAGHITIFDRSWYGRVMVERVEGFCTEEEWRRAYREINEMEQHLTNFGAVVLKFWLQIDAGEQLRRFEKRQATEYKRWKITDEDWRNREKWDEYKSAVEEMLFRTSTPTAPWTIVESNCKLHARIKVIDTVIKEVGKRLKG
jgi:polyphosphate:AMP phosphotransferase